MSIPGAGRALSSLPGNSRTLLPSSPSPRWEPGVAVWSSPVRQRLAPRTQASRARAGVTPRFALDLVTRMRSLRFGDEACCRRTVELTRPRARTNFDSIRLNAKHAIAARVQRFVGPSLAIVQTAG